MARGTLTDKQADIIAKALCDGKTQAEACELAGMSRDSCWKTCQNKKVIQRKLELEAEQERREAQRDGDTEEPLTKKQFLAFVKKRMDDPNIKDEVKAKYVDMYGRGISAFTEKLEIEQNVSYAEILTKRKNKK